IAYSLSDPGKVNKPLKAPMISEILGASGLAMPRLGIAVRIFPNDKQIPALKQLSEARARRRMLVKLFPDAPGLWDAVPHQLAYKPERRYTARLERAEEPLAVLKLYAPGGFEAAARNARVYRGTRSLLLSEAIAISTRHRAVALSWLKGESVA